MKPRMKRKLLEIEDNFEAGPSHSEYTSAHPSVKSPSKVRSSTSSEERFDDGSQSKRAKVEDPLENAKLLHLEEICEEINPRPRKARKAQQRLSQRESRNFSPTKEGLENLFQACNSAQNYDADHFLSKVPKIGGFSILDQFRLPAIRLFTIAANALRRRDLRNLRLLLNTLTNKWNYSSGRATDMIFYISQYLYLRDGFDTVANDLLILGSMKNTQQARYYLVEAARQYLTNDSPESAQAALLKFMSYEKLLHDSSTIRSEAAVLRLITAAKLLIKFKSGFPGMVASDVRVLLDRTSGTISSQSSDNRQSSLRTFEDCFDIDEAESLEDAMKDLILSFAKSPEEFPGAPFDSVVHVALNYSSENLIGPLMKLCAKGLLSCHSMLAMRRKAEEYALENPEEAQEQVENLTSYINNSCPLEPFTITDVDQALMDCGWDPSDEVRAERNFSVIIQHMIHLTQDGNKQAWRRFWTQVLEFRDLLESEYFGKFQGSVFKLECVMKRGNVEKTGAVKKFWKFFKTDELCFQSLDHAENKFGKLKKRHREKLALLLEKKE
ncbi:unnamed protein product [Notodromas monacha]|uniref:Uncharacterized protein n=1 Tax=Notodromas monacha TaxID=399045 RepID=A0A7R9BV49_9CRUS|nr:unnamed protein product [Notodromas monacha]CAG0921350.1 unnamed protein product [Notodromas monacha]